jgi:hypothetical protein
MWSFVLAVAYDLLLGFLIILLKKIITLSVRRCQVRLYETCVKMHGYDFTRLNTFFVAAICLFFNDARCAHTVVSVLQPKGMHAEMTPHIFSPSMLYNE